MLRVGEGVSPFSRTPSETAGQEMGESARAPGARGDHDRGHCRLGVDLCAVIPLEVAGLLHERRTIRRLREERERAEASRGAAGEGGTVVSRQLDTHAKHRPDCARPRLRRPDTARRARSRRAAPSATPSAATPTRTRTATRRAARGGSQRSTCSRRYRLGRGSMRRIAAAAVLLAAVTGAPSADQPATNEPATTQPASERGWLPVVRWSTRHGESRTGRRDVTLRLIGIDTPESVHPSEPVECYGPEAFRPGAKAARWAAGAAGVRSDAGRLDKYGWTLAYVWLGDGRMFNEVMIRGGFAEEYTYAAPYKYQRRFQAAEHAAKSRGAGVCGAPVPGPRLSCPPSPSQPATAQIPVRHLQGGGRRRLRPVHSRPGFGVRAVRRP